MSRIYILIIFAYISCGCSKNSFPTPNENLNVVEFSCIKKETGTKANSVFPIGNIVTIYAYPNGRVAGSVGGTPTNAAASLTGVLTTASCIYLPKGYYDFYSVSGNNSYPPDIVFNNGLSGNLENFVDYLWAGNKNFNVDKDAYVTFEHKHLACRIQIWIEANDRINEIEVNYVKLTYPATDGVKMHLSEGFITSSEYVSAKSIVPGYGNSRSTICLPCNSPLQVEINVNACIDGQIVNDKSYGTTISNRMVGGNSYDITLNINPDNSISASCSIVDWKTILNNITY